MGMTADTTIKPKRTRKAKTTEPAVSAPAVEVITTYKGFDANLKCRGFQYEVGKTYEHDGRVKACSSGFHACEHPLDVFGYYPPAGSRFAIVKQHGPFDRDGGDTKVASARISIEAELRLPELIQAAVDWVFARAKWTDGPVATAPNEAATASGDQGAATASGDQGAATASGTRGAATASGDQGAATASGYQGAATASGTRGAATASGYQGAATASGTQGAATASGTQGAATASGYEGRARGEAGNALFLVYRDPYSGEIEHAWAGIVGRDGIKPMTWYTLSRAGKPVEVGA
jgi:hypothetical protein